MRKETTFFFIIFFCIVKFSTQQCTCPTTSIPQYDFSGIPLDTRTPLFQSVAAGTAFDIIIPSNLDTITFDTCNSTDDTYLSVFKTDCSLLKFNDDFCDFQSLVTFRPTTTTVRVVVNSLSCGTTPFQKPVKLFMTAVPVIVLQQPPNFLPFGPAAGDSALIRCDDCSSQKLTLPVNIQYFQQKYKSLYVSTNGLISLTQQVYAVSPLPFPQAGAYEKTPLIAPYWADADTRPKDGGFVFYRVSTDPIPTEDAAVGDIFNITNFQSDVHIVVTWYKVGYYPQQTDKLNTFQMVIYSQSTKNYTIAQFNYAPSGINWVTGSGGTDGFGGYPAKSGFDKGDGANSFDLPNSGTESIQNIDDGTNVSKLGTYYYRMDNKTIIDPSACVPNVVCKASASLIIGEPVTFEDLDGGSFVCPATLVYITPPEILCSMYPSTILTLHLDYFNCGVDVTVVDPYPPVFNDCTTSTVTISTDPDVCYSRFTPNVTDNCSITSPPGTYLAPVGPSTKTFSATDMAGNTNTCTYNLMVVDGANPFAICKSTTTYLDVTGHGTILPSDINNNSYDGCALSSSPLSASPTTFDCRNIGTSYSILTVTDASNNIDTCNATVYVVDNFPPNAQCRPSIVVPITGATAPILSSYLDNGSTDNCYVESFSLSVNSVGCANTKTALPVTLTVTDHYGNTDQCTTNVFANDTTRPTAQCKDIIKKFQGTDTVMVIVPSDIDNGSFDNCGIASLSIIGNNQLPKGGYGGAMTLLAVDVNGLTSTCVGYVTTPIGRTDYLVAPTEVELYLPFEVTWPRTTDIGDDDLIGLRVIDTITFFSYKVIDDYPYSDFLYDVKDGLYNIPPERNYLLVMSVFGGDYASTPIYVHDFRKY